MGFIIIYMLIALAGFGVYYYMSKVIIDIKIQNENIRYNMSLSIAHNFDSFMFQLDSQKVDFQKSNRIYGQINLLNSISLGGYGDIFSFIRVLDQAVSRSCREHGYEMHFDKEVYNLQISYLEKRRILMEVINNLTSSPILNKVTIEVLCIDNNLSVDFKMR